MLASLTSWLTPSSLFLVLNIVIGTILLISRFTTSIRPPYHYHQPGPDYGAPSLLERVKSFDFSSYNYKYDHLNHEAPFVHPSEPQYTAPPPLERTPSFLERVKSLDFSFYKYDHLNHEAPFVHPSEPQYTAPPPLERTPSFLERVKSFDFSFYKYDHSNHEAPFVHLSEQQHTAPPPLERTPSFLERVKSINFSLYNFAPSCSETDCVSHQQPEYEGPQPDSPQLSRTPSFLERVKSITSFYRSNSIKGNPETEFPPQPETDSGTDMIREHSPVHRSKSESQVTQSCLPEKIKKSASENSRHKEDDEEVERRRPQKVRMEKTESFGESSDVDAKADDFINSFKQQLKLQRLDSLLRYREMFKGK
ncbi:hypothetical protein SLA2020_505900 [Shorea laevis]